MLVDSIVVRKGAYNPEKINELHNPAKTKRAFTVLGICCLLTIGGIYFGFQKMESMKPLLTELMSLKQRIEQNTQLTNVSPNHNWRNFTQADSTTRQTSGINLSAFLKKSKFDNENLRLTEAKKAVDIIIKTYSRLSECDYITVQVRTGYNIGIWSLYFKHDLPYTTDGQLIKQKSIELNNQSPEGQPHRLKW